MIQAGGVSEWVDAPPVQKKSERLIAILSPSRLGDLEVDLCYSKSY